MANMQPLSAWRMESVGKSLVQRCSGHTLIFGNCQKQSVSISRIGVTFTLYHGGGFVYKMLSNIKIEKAVLVKSHCINNP